MYLLTALLALGPATAFPEPDEALKEDETIRPDGIHVLDGSYVLNIGQFHVNITNHGLIGSQFSSTFPWSVAPSGEWPGGSGHEYLWGAGLWVGGMVNGDTGVTTGQPQRELRPDHYLIDTIYEAQAGKVVRPWPSDVATGRLPPELNSDDDGDGAYDEDQLNGRDDDGDGRIDEDFGQIGDQMFTCTMHDYTPLVQELYPGHFPLGITVVQKAASWVQAEKDDIVALDFEITNTSNKIINDVYLGFYVDGDIQRRGEGTTQPDDLAGLWTGTVRGVDGAFCHLEVAWMRDGARNNPLPGWFGTVLLHHKTHFLSSFAPRIVGIRSYQLFATNARVDQNGEPTEDSGRYHLMSLDQHDPDWQASLPADLKFMISSGPFGQLHPREKLDYRLAMVMGGSQAEMLANALQAVVLAKGSYFNLDHNYETGGDGREMKICVGDLPGNFGLGDPQSRYYADFMDEACFVNKPRMGIIPIRPEDLYEDIDGRKCIYVNADNCEECFRAMGEECTIENQLFWRFKESFYPYSHPEVFTGLRGEAHVPWIFSGETPPSPPNMRLVPGNNQVEIFWDDVSEYDLDWKRGVVDFESYRIWRVANWTRPPGSEPGVAPTMDKWGMITEFDIPNFIPAGATVSPTTLPLGHNTGLESAFYDPACLDDPSYDGLAEAMAGFVEADRTGIFISRPPLRDTSGSVIPGREALVAWESTPAVLDTFFAVTPREAGTGIIGKRSTRYYHFIDDRVHNGFHTFYSVVATDHTLAWDDEGQTWLPTGEGIQSEPGNNFQQTIPAPIPQTAEMRETEGVNIYVYPNPATREALAKFQMQPPSINDPTGERIMFTNLPAANNTISIFTASGDLIETIYHNGHNGRGSVSWNLMSRNGQEVVSGIYLYTVQSDDSRFSDFQGRFVIIR